MSWFPSRISSMAAGAVAFHRFVLDPVAAPWPGLRCAGVVMTGRRLLSIRFPPGGVNGHHPYCLFTRVITAGLFAPRRSGIGLDRAAPGGVSLGGLEQAELAGAGDRRGARIVAKPTQQITRVNQFVG
jgi:hypothetical protein